MLCPRRRRHAVAQRLSVLRTARRPLSDGSGGAAALRGDQRNARGRARRRARDGRGRRRAALRRARGDAARRPPSPEARGVRTRATLRRRGRGLHVPQLRLHDVRQPERRLSARCGLFEVALEIFRGPRAYVADGARGAGKSVALAQIVTQARARLALRAPRRARARDVGHHGDYGVHASSRTRAASEEPSRSREVLRAGAGGARLSALAMPSSARTGRGALGRRSAARGRGRRPRRQEARRRGVDGAGRRRRRFEGARQRLVGSRRPLIAAAASCTRRSASSPRRPTTTTASASVPDDLVHIRALRGLGNAGVASSSARDEPGATHARHAVARRRRPRAARPAPRHRPRALRDPRRNSPDAEFAAAAPARSSLASAPRTTSRRSSSRRSALPRAEPRLRGDVSARERSELIN